jgi:two-component system cell cycle sensor histidine kinase/response regulator CckA
LSVPLRVLILEDRPADVQLMLYELRQAGFEPQWRCVETEHEFLEQLQLRPELILSDFSMPTFDAMRALRLTREVSHEIPFIVVSGSIGEDVAVEAMKQGATDYLLKDRLGRLGGAVKNALEQMRLRAETRISDRARQESTDLLRAIAEWTPDAVFVKDRNGRYLLFNPAASQFVGRNVEDVLGRDDTELFDADGARRVMKRDRRVMATGQIETEEELLTARGVTRTFLATKAPYRDRDGNIIGVIGISRDITDQKAAEAERNLLLARLRLQVERMPLGCLMTDADFRIIDWNPAAERIFGYTKSEMLGIGPPFSKVLAPAAWPDCKQVLDRIRAGDMSAHSVNENITFGGRNIVCEWNNTPLTDASGAFIGMVSIFQDITGRRDAEEALKLRDRAIQAVTQGIVICDASLPDNPIIYISPSFEELTGYTSAEVVGKNCRFLQGAETDPESVLRIRNAIAAGLPCKVELLNYRKDGTSFWNELCISPVRDASGRITHLVGSQADVSGRRKLEEQFRQVQKMEAIGRLAGGVAHDFNNLLTIINGYSELILDGLSKSDRMAELVSQIHKAGERAAGLTRQLLAFSRKQMLQPVVVEMNTLILDMKKLLRPLIREDIQLILNLAPDLKPIDADRGQIEQVILNLILNARDAMPTGGTLSLSTQNVRLDASHAEVHTEARPGDYVMLAVCDTGCGMDKLSLARIFEPFFTTKEADKGTGLGLSTVYGIVKQSNGHIEVSSELGLGSTFKIYFPAGNGKEIATSPDTVEQLIPEGNETILLVEDERGVRTLAAQVLRSSGYTVLEAANGQEAMETFRKHHDKVQLIVTDVVMPIMGGRQLIEELGPRLPAVKVLFMSGYTEDAVVLNGLLNCEADFLQKPFNVVSLKLKVRDLLNRHPTSDSLPRTE